jgi:hypothetical protein
MLDVWRAQVPHGWVTGDDELGRHTGFRQALRERGERYVLGVPCTTTMRDLEALPPAYQGRGRCPKAPWQSVVAWRQSLDPRSLAGDSRGETVRRVPWLSRWSNAGCRPRMEHKCIGPAEWLVITRRPVTDERTLEARALAMPTDH